MNFIEQRLWKLAITLGLGTERGELFSEPQGNESTT